MISRVFLILAISLTAGCQMVDEPSIRMLSDRMSKLENLSRAKDGGAENNYFVYRVKARNGAKIPVKVFQKGPSLFVGPRGEEYDCIPTVWQIQAMYGN